MTTPDVINFVVASKPAVMKDLKKNWPMIRFVLACIFGYILFSTLLFRCFELPQPLFSNWPAWFRALYFTVINVTTVGFGDVTPQTWPGQGLAMVNSFVGVAAFGFLVASITAALQPSEWDGKGSAEFRDRGGDDNFPTPVIGAAMILRGMSALIAAGDSGDEKSERQQHEGTMHMSSHIFVDAAGLPGGGADVVVELRVVLRKLQS